MQNKNAQKRKINRVLHPNRHFIWAIVLIVLSGTALCAYILISSYKDDYGSVYPQVAERRIFVDQAAGYSAVYPSDWQLERDSKGNTIFENPANPEESIAVYSGTLKQEKVIRGSFNIVREKDFVRNGVTYEIISTGTVSGGSDVDLALVKTPAKLFYITGFSDLFEKFVNDFKPL